MAFRVEMTVSSGFMLQGTINSLSLTGVERQQANLFLCSCFHLNHKENHICSSVFLHRDIRQILSTINVHLQSVPNFGLLSTRET